MADKRVIGNFEVIEKLGQGGMGAVFKARQISMDRIVALKVLPPSLAKRPTFIERFLREAHASARLNHPNIVRGIDAGEDAGVFFFAMEYVEGSSAKQVLRQGPMPEERVLQIGEAIAEALAHAHQHGILHRDVKPDNILIEKDGHPKLCDLGLARLESQTEDEKALTQEGSALGTPYYISPEQARGQSDLDARTDLYSLGATLYQLATGKPMFDGATSAVIMAKHLTSKCPDPGESGVRLSDGLVAILAKLLAKDRDDRYESAETLAADLKLVRDGGSPRHAVLASAKWPFTSAPKLLQRKPALGTTAASAGKNRAEQHDPRGRPSARPTLWIVLVGAAVVVTAIFMATRGSDPHAAEPPKASVQSQPERPPAPIIAQGADKAIDPAPGAAKDREADIEATATRLGSEAGSFATQRRFDSAIAVWQKGSAGNAAMEARAAKAITELRAQAETLLQGPLDASDRCVNERRWSDGEKALASIDDVEYQAWRPRIDATRAKLAAGTREDSEVAKVAALAEADDAFTRHANAFVAATLKGDLKGARSVENDTRADPLVKELAAKIQGMSDTCAALEKIDAVRLAALAALKDGKVHSFEKSKETVSGIVAAVTTDDITLQIQIPGGGSGGLKVRFADLTPAERNRLSGAFAPTTPSEHLAVGIRALATGDVVTAKSELGEAKDHPLAPAYQGKLDIMVMGAAEAAAKAEWESIERTAGTGKIPDQRAKELADRIRAFQTEHGKTKFAASIANAMSALQDRLIGQARLLSLDLGGDVKLDVVLISPGKFMMGSPPGEPKRADGEVLHQVTLTQPYYLGKYPVTQEQYEALMGKNPSTIKGPTNPVDTVSWNDAQEFCQQASHKLGKTVRLPTEAEWEYACRAGSTTIYSFGDNDAVLGDFCWFKDNSDDQPGDKKVFAGKLTHPVGSKKPNPWGLYDMHGNVCQWCQDWFDAYTAQPTVDPQGPAQGKGRVLRGGSSNLASWDCRSAFRIAYPPERVNGHVGGFGFRVAVAKN